MDDRELMKVAIEESLKSSEPLKCGCVIVKDGEIVAASFNSQRGDMNATAHAEINAIGIAGKKLGQKNLEDCIAYCSCEPCTMCLSAMLFSKISKLYFGVSIGDVADQYIHISPESLIGSSPYKIEIVKNFMETEVKESLGIG